MRSLAFLALSVFCLFAAAQSDGDGNRGSTPPGLSQDGARPAEGAIKGGSIAPGESGGMPQKEPGGSAAAGGTAAGSGSANHLERCYQLEGTLREQCLERQALNRQQRMNGPTPESATQR